MAALYMPIDTVIWPAYFEAKDDPRSLGAVFVALAGGSVLGAFAFGKLSQRFDSYRLLRLVIITSTCALAPMSLLPPTWLVVVLGFVAGVSWGPFNPLWNSVVQRRIEPHLQGRVYGLQMSVLYAAPPLGQVVVGYSVDQLGIQPTFFVVIGLFLVFAVLLTSVPVLRKL
jgi:MFS family permease